MSSTPTALPAWRGEDLEAIRLALAIPATPAAMRAVNDAMARIEDLYPDAIPAAQAALDGIAAIDVQLAALTAEDLRPPLEVRRKGAVAGAPGTPGATDPELPLRKADVIERDTDLLQEETLTRWGAGPSPLALLRQQRIDKQRVLLLCLPALAAWSTDPAIPVSGTAPFTTALARG
jgi:hypothetical protein